MFPVSIKESSVRRYLVVEGDIVVANRGGRFTAAMIPDGMTAIASGQLLIVKILAEKLKKEYLHWYLNLNQTQEYLRGLSRGNRVRALSVSVLRKKLVPLPAMSVQEKIVEIVQLSAREKCLTKRLQSLRRQWVEELLLEAVQ